MAVRTKTKSHPGPATGAPAAAHRMSRVEVGVPSPHVGGGIDRVLMRVPPSLKAMAAKGTLSPSQIKAAAWFASTVESSAGGGVSAVDYGRIKVDTSIVAKAPLADFLGKAIRDRDAARELLGRRSFSLLTDVVINGLSVTEAAIKWSDNKRLKDGGVDREIRGHIALCVRDALEEIADHFCRQLDPDRFGVKRGS